MTDYARIWLRSTALAGVLITAAFSAAAQDAALPSVTARLETVASATGEVSSAVAYVYGAVSGFVGATALGGLEVYDAEGRRLSSTPAGETVGVDIAYGFDLAGQSITLAVAVDISQNALRFFRLDGSSLTEVGTRAVPLGFAAENLCLFRNGLDGALYAFVVGDGGEIDQQLIYATAEGQVDSRQARRLNVISTVKQCAVDSASATVYASEEGVGIWRFNANPEAFAAPTLIDTPRFGKITEEVGGLALYDGGEGARYLIASDASAGRLNVYDRGRDDAYVGSVSVTAREGGDPISEPGPMFATSMAFPGLASGLLVTADEDASNFKSLAFADLASTLNLSAGEPFDPRVDIRSAVPTVVATVETASVASYGDAADDPAIWAHPTDPGKSLVVATDKKGGLFLYDMQGRVVQDLRDGKMNNVDLREGFQLAGRPTILVTASNRTSRSISIYALDPETRTLVNVSDGVQETGLLDPYGQCMYREPTSGRTYVFITGDDTRLRQWELIDAGNGKVRAEFKRELAFDSQTEGCVADDANGVVYANEEDVGLWRFAAAPDGGTDKTLIHRVVDNAATKDDFEGIGLYDLGDGRGYLVLSSQGNDTYAVYRREGDNAYLGSFAVAADPRSGIDGVSETDGLEITSRDLGPGFEAGAMIAQDGRNVLPVENQNYKYVPWSAIAEALGLETR